MTNFPPRPSENSDPWYSAREAYDAFLETEINARFRSNRLSVPDNTDLDTLTNTEHSGTWSMHPTRTYLNAPPEISTTFATLLVFNAAGASAAVQMYIGRDGIFWYRQKPGNTIWGDWQKFPTTVPRVLTLDDDIDTLPPGQYVTYYDSTAGSLGLPSRIGTLTVMQITPTVKLQKYETNQGVISQSGTVRPYEIWIRGMDLERNYYPNFERVLPISETEESGAPVSHTVRATRAKSTYTQATPYYSKSADTLDRPASTTKVYTGYIARQVINDGLLDLEVTVLASDKNPGGSGASTPLKVGDVVTFRDLFYLTMLPSHNQAASILARAAGERLPGTGDPYDRFVAKMQADTATLGWAGAVFVNPTGLGSTNQISADQLIELMYLVGEDSWFMEVMGTQTYSVEVGGPDERTIEAQHTVDPDGAVKFPDMIAAKSGTLSGHTCLVMWYRKSNGTFGCAALMGSNTASRYLDMRMIINYAKEGRDRQYLVNPT